VLLTHDPTLGRKVAKVADFGLAGVSVWLAACLAAWLAGWLLRACMPAGVTPQYPASAGREV
jgi:hypothetical protein